MLISVSFLLKTLAPIRLDLAYVLAEMVNHSDGESLCAPLDDIAYWCGYEDKELTRVINRLVRRGLIEIEPTANTYHFSQTVLVAVQRWHSVGGRLSDA